MEAMRRAVNQIEDNVKMLKHLPDQKLHPFDLSQQELIQIK